MKREDNLLFVFTVDFVDELEETSGLKSESGILYASNHVEATKMICDYYGENNVEKVAVSIFDISILTFPNSELNYMMNLINGNY